MIKNQLILGSHVSMKAPDYFLGSVQEAIEYDANALMIYTGPPQNTLRKDIKFLKIPEAKKLWISHNCDLSNVIIHAPYIINLASFDENKRSFGVEFLIKEVKRTKEFGAKYIVLHPGSSVGTTSESAIKNLISSLNEVISKTNDVIICLETMAGKGNEIGRNFEQLKEIISKIKDQKRIGVCFDTCHVNDAGYNLADIDSVLNQFDKTIGLNKIFVFHFNDSLNQLNSHKDRHDNIGYGTIGFDNLLKIIYHKKLVGIPFILETPYVNDQAPYKDEIKMIKNKKFNNPFTSKKQLL